MSNVINAARRFKENRALMDGQRPDESRVIYSRRRFYKFLLSRTLMEVYSKDERGRWAFILFMVWAHHKDRIVNVYSRRIHSFTSDPNYAERIHDPVIY